MPSQLHEALLELFRNSPELAPMLLKGVLGEVLPDYVEIQMPSGELTDVQPAEYRADLVLVLRDGDGRAVFSMAVEAQLRVDPAKRFSLPSYCVLLRARNRCPAAVLVVTPDEAVARWAAQPIDLGCGNWFTPLVIGPAAIPWITDPDIARQAPELSVLSAMAHGRDGDIDKVVSVALAGLGASFDLDDDKSLLYCDLIRSSLSEAAKKALQTMDLATYEYQSEFAKRYYGQGREEGVVQGREEGVAQGREEGVVQGREEGVVQGREEGVAQGRISGQKQMLLRQMTRRFGPLPADVVSRVQASDTETLEELAERFVTAESLGKLFD